MKFEQTRHIMPFSALDFSEKCAAKVFFGCFVATNDVDLFHVFCTFLSILRRVLVFSSTNGDESFKIRHDTEQSSC